MKTTATGETIKKLVSKGLVQKVTMDLGRGREQGNVYSLPLPVRLTESVRLTKSVHIKEKDIKKDIKGKSAAPDYKTCPDCQGSGFWYPEGVEKGVAKCRHERMGK
jgi:DnaJ-class molecular chaperone